MSSNPTRDKLLLNDKVGKNKKADRTTTAIVHTLRDTHHSQTCSQFKMRLTLLLIFSAPFAFTVAQDYGASTFKEILSFQMSQYLDTINCCEYDSLKNTIDKFNHHNKGITYVGNICIQNIKIDGKIITCCLWIYSDAGY